MFSTFSQPFGENSLKRCTFREYFLDDPTTDCTGYTDVMMSIRAIYANVSSVALFPSPKKTSGLSKEYLNDISGIGERGTRADYEAFTTTLSSLGSSFKVMFKASL